MIILFNHFQFLSFLKHFFPVAPQISHFDFGDEPINEGDTVSVQCTVLKGDSPLNISWKFNNKTIEPPILGININTMKRVSLITMESVNAEHAGKYECVAGNKAGNASFSSVLNINGIFTLLNS